MEQKSAREIVSSINFARLSDIEERRHAEVLFYNLAEVVSDTSSSPIAVLEAYMRVNGALSFRDWHAEESVIEYLRIHLKELAALGGVRAE